MRALSRSTDCSTTKPDDTPKAQGQRSLKTGLEWGRVTKQMADNEPAKSTDTPTRLRTSAHSRSRATSSSSVRTALSIHASPLKVSTIPSTSQPELSQDYASAQMKNSRGEAIPELKKTLSDLDLRSREDERSSSSSSRERTPRPDRHENGSGTPNKLEPPFRPEVAATLTRNPLGSRRSTISASATTTSLNLNAADSITVSSSAEGASGLLSKSAGSRVLESATRSRKRDKGVINAESACGSAVEGEDQATLHNKQQVPNGNAVNAQGKIVQAQHQEPGLTKEKQCESFSRKMSRNTL